MKPKKAIIERAINNGRLDRVNRLLSATHVMVCVANGYYKKPDSLILSARDKEGKRVETIEVNLTVLKIAQCYGACNKLTEHHQEILDLVNDNMWKIKERRNQILEAV